ncbi:site-2 protease family protein [Patescibacteria group bacterium]|nr:site-2 protease family protein [Patescibacteria group bacterium]MBU4452794.1 site-2 protease family protein [Patescibacteria group bacterium]
MILSLLFGQPMLLMVWLAAILISLTVHEFSHAWMANIKGDKTAELAGRLTLNPLAHIDVMGMVLLVTLGFGWAKPVPFNPYNLQDPRRDSLLIALAGPASNLVMATLASIVLRAMLVVGMFDQMSLLFAFLLLLVIINLFLMFFNIVPIYPLDGSKVLDALLVKPEHQRLRMQIAMYGPKILFALVMISIFTSFNIFFFVSEPSYFVCSKLVGENCLGLFGLIF